MKQLIVSAYGGGTNSTALLIKWVLTGNHLDLILFADTAGEKPHTYKYVETFSQWLVDHGAPPITIVKKVRRTGEIHGLEENCLEANMLPSLAYGFKSCSQKFKIGPQDKYVNNWPPAKKSWKAGIPILKLIGYDAGEPHRAEGGYDNDKYVYRYPLIEWNMGREECVETIEGEGLCLPGKSACFFCPASTINEIKQLNATYPDLMERAIKMEANADLTSVKGLGRRFAWKDVIATDEMFPDEFRMAPELLCGCYDGD